MFSWGKHNAFVLKRMLVIIIIIIIITSTCLIKSCLPYLKTMISGVKTSGKTILSFSHWNEIVISYCVNVIKWNYVLMIVVTGLNLKILPSWRFSFFYSVIHNVPTLFNTVNAFKFDGLKFRGFKKNAISLVPKFVDFFVQKKKIQLLNLNVNEMSPKFLSFFEKGYFVWWPS